MFDINDDMEELLRRAAEGYPLKTDSADWDKVAKKISGNRNISTQKKNWFNNRRSLLLLSLLLPAAFVCNRYSQTLNKQNVSKVEPFNRASQSVDNKKPVTDAIVKTAANQISSNTPPNVDEAIENKIASTTSTSTILKTSALRNLYSDVLSTSKKAEQPFQIDKMLPEQNMQPLLSSETSLPTAAVNSTVTEQPANNNTNSTNEVDTTNQSKNIGQAVKVKANSTKKTAHFYFGIVASADVSSVKFQSFRSPGTGVGILLGYNVSKRLSFESGVYKQKKFYYTDAKYYNPETPYTAPNYKLLHVNGNCTMFEVPVNLKYDFIIKTNAKLFAVAGVSSYFMKKENYTYTAETQGLVTDKNITYNNSSSAILSVVNVSAAYQHVLGKSSTLRIEPYIKIPTKGFGWGRLPIMSAGLNVGYVKSIF